MFAGSRCALRAVRCPQLIYGVSNRELQQESLRLGRRSFLPHAAHGARVHSKDVLLNLVLPYDIFTSPQGFFVCIQSIYDHWAWGACGAALRKLLCALVGSRGRSFAPQSSRIGRVLSCKSAILSDVWRVSASEWMKKFSVARVALS